MPGRKAATRSKKPLASAAKYAEAKRRLAAANKDVNKSSRAAAQTRKRSGKAYDNALTVLADLKMHLSLIRTQSTTRTSTQKRPEAR